MVQPLADRLGFDAVIATRYREAADGRYDGTIDGEFVWGPGKLRGGPRLGRRPRHRRQGQLGVLRQLLRRAAAQRRGPPGGGQPRRPACWRSPRCGAGRSSTSTCPPGVAKLPLLGMELSRMAQYAAAARAAALRALHVRGRRQHPRRRAGHPRAPTTAATSTRWPWPSPSPASTGPVRFLGKREVFAAPVVGPVARAMGGIPVDRATGSDEPLAGRGRGAGGGRAGGDPAPGHDPAGPGVLRPRAEGPAGGRPSWPTSTRVPVIPVGLWGTEHVWPRRERLPRVWNLTHPPHVTVTRRRAGRARSTASADADTKRIMAAISDLLPPEAREPLRADGRRAGAHVPGRPRRRFRRGRPPARRGLSPGRPGRGDRRA